MAELDPDRILALSYVPARRRAAIDALWRLDLALGAVLAGGRDPMLSRIKLVWWRDALDALDGKPAPAEPALQAVARDVLPHGITGAEMSGAEEGWAVLLSAEPLSAQDLEIYARQRGGRLFHLSARLLGGDSQGAVEAAGAAWALADLARHSNADDASAAIAALRALPPVPRLPGRLRPLGMLAALARRDAEPGRPRWEPQGAPGRMWRMLRYRLTGL